jgi:predicted helicase
MLQLNVKPGDRLIKGYYEALGRFGHQYADHEGAVRVAFHDVLSGYSKRLDWTLISEYPVPGHHARNLRVDGALLDFWKQRRGFWEAKDEHDDLEREIKSKIEKGYPTSNIIFQAPDRAILYQHGVRQGLNENIREPKNLAALLAEFFRYREPDHEEWDAAVAEFKQRIPELADRAEHLIEAERKSNKAFRASFDGFYELCRQAINPNLSAEAVEKMLIQHLLTERIFARIFKNTDFRNKNVIAAEIEKVIQSMTSRHFSRDEFLSDLDRFYKVIERAADDKEDYFEKQGFLNNVYERFFQGYSPKEADTHGIVYTPQPIVDFMVRSVEDILKKEFGKSLADKGVHILDPFVGTGNFITRIMKQIAETRKSALPYKYDNELHCNEIMLLPYYIASMNIEHEYSVVTGEYKPFEGICLVDTFELAEPEQQGFSFMTEENTARVKRQKESPIFVIVGNPPYNMGQINENDQNKNRKYTHLDEEIRSTYMAESNATLLNKLGDPYVKAIRWASSRIGDEGVVALITNNSFIDQLAFDGMRKCIAKEFHSVYVLDLGGNVRKNPKLSGTIHNVFGIQVGVSINFFVRSRAHRHARSEIYYASAPTDWKKEQRLDFLSKSRTYSAIEWSTITPDTAGTWLNEGSAHDFETLVPLACRSDKHSAGSESIFGLYSLGLVTNRDAYVYDFNAEQLIRKTKRMIAAYRRALASAKEDERPDVGDLIDVSDSAIKWTRQVKAALSNRRTTQFDAENIRQAQYRPFTTKLLYFDNFWNEEQYQLRHVFPIRETELENRVLVVSAVGYRAPYSALAVHNFPELHLCASTDGFQCFPFYAYDEDGSNRQENITDWALNEYRTHYNDSKITKWDIFHYVYALLHHPDYRERYAANLKRELPRIPYAPDFWGFAKAGKQLAELHVNYEKQPEYPLERIENPSEKISYCVEKMRLGKDKTALIYNSFLTLSGIPPEVYEYRLGNRSALEWVIDQYQVSTDKRSGITNDPNHEDDPEYIVRLIGQVMHVSLETVKIVKALPMLGIEIEAATQA